MSAFIFYLAVGKTFQPTFVHCRHMGSLFSTLQWSKRMARPTAVSRRTSL